MSSIGCMLWPRCPFPGSLRTSSGNNTTFFSWSSSAIQKPTGHGVVSSHGSQQSGSFEQACASASGSKLEVQELSKKAANNDVILDRVSFEVKAGAVHALVGPSGSGKTTILRALNRLWEPSTRTIFYEGVDVTTMDVIGLRLKVGLVFQAAALFPGTVADNVKYGPKLRDIDLSTERLEELLLQAGISEPTDSFLRKSSGELSGGEAKRVSIARALANEPSVLLMDEPTSSLDPISTRIVEESILNLVNNVGLTVVWVSHDVHQIGRVADIATMLGKGGIVLETATPADLRRSENVVLTEFFASVQY